VVRVRSRVVTDGQVAALGQFIAVFKALSNNLGKVSLKGEDESIAGKV
jgi:hypothetical protein